VAEPAAEPAGVSIVVPTLARPSLDALLAGLAAQAAQSSPQPVELILVDDRPPAARTEPLPAPTGPLAAVTKVVTGRARGPAAARNTGWRSARYPWVSFLDDDVLLAPGWLDHLARDLAVPDAVVGVQGRIEVPLPAGRRPTDWERVTAGLAQGQWLTADMAYRRSALAAVGGFDERFPRAFREDAELAWRVRRAGGVLAVGQRRVVHPVRPESPWVSVRVQRGNADDALLRRMYGPRWRSLLGIPAGRRSRHAAVTASGALALVAAGVAGQRRMPGRRLASLLAVAGGLGWLAGTAEFAAARIAPGPRTPDEVARMVVTSALIPPVATGYWLAGWWKHRRG
jgi:cellulose synthase/poly-beta-1,6-N-acetylglucosamine synthase-like glycosyltransferase